MLFSDTALSTSRFISSSVAKANCSPHLDINFNCNYRQKRLERMLFSDTALSTSRFISSSVAKANCSPHLDINFNCKQDARLEVFEIGEYHLENINGYSPVLAAVYSVT